MNATEQIVHTYETQLANSDEQLVDEMSTKWKAQLDSVNVDIEKGVYVARIRSLESKNMTLRAQLQVAREAAGA